MDVRGDFLGPPHGTTTRTLICRNRFFNIPFFELVFIAPAYSRVRYRSSNFRPSVRSFVRSSVRSSINIYVEV